MINQKFFFAVLFVSGIFASIPLNLASASNTASMQFKSGGIGLEAREQVNNTLPGYHAKLVFVDSEGNYFANVRVTIQGDTSSRTVISEGPWLYLKGAPGLYKVQARAGDAKGGTTVRLTNNGEKTIIIQLTKDPQKS